MKLGKGKKRNDERNKKLSAYVKAEELPTLPPSFDWTGKVTDWEMLGNDVAGDCTIAGLLHYFMGCVADNGGSFVPTTDQAISIYSAVTGYVPGNEATDNGAVELDVLKYARKKGFDGHFINGFAEIDVQDIRLVKYAIWLFGGCYVGVLLPKSVDGAPAWLAPENLEGDNAPDSWGGHCVLLTGFDDAAQKFTAISWGKPLPVDYGFWLNYGDEAYALESPDFVTGAKPAPSGFDLQTLNEDLKQL